MEETEIRVESWTHLQDVLFADAWNDEIRRFRAPYVYRGLSNSGYRLATSLMRLGGQYAVLERHLLRNFRKYSHGASAHYPSIWHLLAVAQHHGLPTRLLDWTYSPYIALHFATANVDRYEHDGVIWAVNFELAHRLLPAVMRDALEAEGAQAFTVELLANLGGDVETHGDDSSFFDVIRSLERFDKLGEPEDFLMFFEPPSLDQRIINQYALFSVLPNNSLSVDTWLQRHDDLYRRIVIPKELKWECRDKLDQSNVTERVLFPGLDGLSAWLSRHYSPRDRDAT